MASVTIEVPDRVAEALGSLDAPLAADEVAFAAVIRWSIHQAEHQLADIASDSDFPAGGKLRQVAARLEVLADACEAVA